MKHDHKQFARRGWNAASFAERLRAYWRGNRAHAGQLYQPASTKPWWVP